MGKKVQVSIKLKQVNHYNQVVEMDEEDWLILKDLRDYDVDDSQTEYGIIEKYLNYSDVFDSDHEFTDVEIKHYRPKP